MSGTGRRVLLWRHGQTTWNVERRFQGQTDIPLTDEGLAQARRSARLLAALRPDAIVSSDLTRTVDTAAELARLVDVPVTLDPALRETYAGEWQGLTNREIEATFPEQFAAWRRGEPVRRGGGELESEVAERMAEAINLAVEKLPDDGTLVVVSHGGAIRCGLGALLGLPRETWGALGALSNCCWSVLGPGARGWRLLEHNAGTLPEPVIGDDV
ncbi:histidine phosphatase family protein [Embleya scabrispora]|uniref:histidine phosphatase family protein n=1 Tax=Embleya scabrispora TaxID=159449 RepID=UPI001913537A|nr:histidine phosphatase family protein [Embleya scabrispora]